MCSVRPHLVGMHGCAHRLELAVRDTLKDVALMSRLDDILEQCYKMYNKYHFVGLDFKPWEKPLM